MSVSALSYNALRGAQPSDDQVGGLRLVVLMHRKPLRRRAMLPAPPLHSATADAPLLSQRLGQPADPWLMRFQDLIDCPEPVTDAGAGAKTGGRGVTRAPRIPEPTTGDGAFTIGPLGAGAGGNGAGCDPRIPGLATGGGTATGGGGVVAGPPGFCQPAGL